MIAYVVNPGSTSTKLALAEIERGDNPALPSQLKLALRKTELQHPTFGPGLPDLSDLNADLLAAAADWPAPDVVVAPGDLRTPDGRPADGGAYRVTPELAAALLAQPHGESDSSVGAALALALAQARGGLALIAQPPTDDDLLPEARISGLKGSERLSRLHGLNARLVARRAAHEQGVRFPQARVVVAHLGGSVSVSAFEGGRIIDTTGARLDEGPFTPSRIGSLPTHALLDLAYSRPRSELEALLLRKSGFVSLTGTGDLRELEKREKTDPGVKLAAEAFAHQVAKAIGAYSAALSARPHAIALTGGIARWSSVVGRIESRVGWIAPVSVLPGELELDALAESAGRVLTGIEDALDWPVSG
jgi:butyrate kinase